MSEENFVNQYMKSCRLCPRECGADRLAGQRGACGVPADVYVARAALHFWEEPCISGANGSGAVFFTGCGLKCVYCQNAPISGTAKDSRTEDRLQHENVRYGQEGMRTGPGVLGKRVTIDHLADIFLKLQDEQGANNINLVTAVQYIPQVAEALRMAKEKGLTIPVVYNSSGYEKTGSLKLLEGLVDVWLPDFKYMDPETAKLYSHAPDYPQRAKEAIAEMVRQAGEPEFYDEPAQEKKAGSKYPPGGKLIRRGVIVRHLLLPGHVKDAKEVVKYLHETYGNSIYISMMNQYTPMAGVQTAADIAGRQTPAGKNAAGMHSAAASDTEQLRLLARKVTRREYERLTDYAVGIGVENGFIQEGRTATESFIPSWNGEGV